MTSLLSRGKTNEPFKFLVSNRQQDEQNKQFLQYGCSLKSRVQGLQSWDLRQCVYHETGAGIDFSRYPPVLLSKKAVQA